MAGFHTENSICAPAVCGYVARMTWSQFLPVVIVLAVGVVFVWHSSTPKNHVHDEHCGCGHDHGDEQKKETAKH